jgi:acetylglutamate kinase
MGCNAIGLTGADGNAIQAVKRPVKEFDFGFVGDVTGINTNLFKLLLQAQHVPVCCAITHDQKGQLLNTNADTIAASIAKGLSKFFDVSLCYCFEMPGVLKNIVDKESVIGEITPNSYNELKINNIIHSGMIPKIDNCFEALNNGVSEVKIGAPEMISGKIKYTKLILDDE